jgi:hypothetical protein
MPGAADPLTTLKEAVEEELLIRGPKRWVYHVTDHDRIAHTVIANDYQVGYRLGLGDGQASLEFYDYHPASPDGPVFLIKASHVKSIEVVREANLPVDEPVSAWTSESDPPRPEACSESVQ